MTKLIIAGSLVLAIIVALSAVAFKIYWSGRQDERAGSVIRAQGMQAEREMINAKTTNVTRKQRCFRNDLDFVPDETGGHCN